MRVLFVCSGNICRSPMAEACLRDRLGRLGASDVDVGSAGTLEIRGRPASREAVQALAEKGIDLSPHRSRGLSEADVQSTELIVGMAREHVATIATRYPGVAGRCVLLRAFENSCDPEDLPPDLPDPIGRPVEFYREELEILGRCVEHLARHIVARRS